MDLAQRATTPFGQRQSGVQLESECALTAPTRRCKPTLKCHFPPEIKAPLRILARQETRVNPAHAASQMVIKLQKRLHWPNQIFLIGFRLKRPTASSETGKGTAARPFLGSDKPVLRALSPDARCPRPISKCPTDSFEAFAGERLCAPRPFGQATSELIPSIVRQRRDIS